MSLNAPSTPGLCTAGLNMHYGSHQVLRDVSLPPLAPGSLTALIGPNAAGKSTLLRGIAGLQKTTGQVLLDGVDLNRLPQVERAQHIVYLPQSLPERTRLCAFEAVLSAAMAGLAWPMRRGVTSPSPCTRYTASAKLSIIAAGGG